MENTENIQIESTENMENKSTEKGVYLNESIEKLIALIKEQQNRIEEMQMKIDELTENHNMPEDHHEVSEDNSAGNTLFHKPLTAQPAIMGDKTSEYYINKNGIITEYIGGDKNITVPYEVDGIPVKGFKASVFAGSDIESISIPKSVKKIPNGAFMDCENLKKCVIPDSIETIGKYAFSGCGALDNVKIPENIRSVGSYAFSECTALKNLELTEGIRNLKGKNIFIGCSALDSVKIPGSMLSVPEGMFAFCTGLKDVIIGSGVKYIRDNAFTGCTIEKPEIPGTIKNIHMTAFLGCPENMKSYINKRFSKGADGSFSMKKNNLPRHAKTREPVYNAPRHAQARENADGRKRIDTIISKAAASSKEKNSERRGSNIKQEQQENI